VRVPPAREVGCEAAGALDVGAFLEKATDHRAQLADLDVLETQLPVQALAIRLVGLGGELVAGRCGEDRRFFLGGVAAQRVVEISDRGAGGVEIAGRGRGEEGAEELVEAAVLPLERGGRRHAACYRGEMRHRHSVALLATLVLVAACGRSGDPVRAVVDAAVKAANARDAKKVVSLLSPGFQAADGSSRADTAAMLEQSFAAYEALNVTVRDVRIERGEGGARVRLRAEMSGQPRRIGGLDGLVPSSSAYDFDLRLVLEDGAWRIAWAQWNPAGAAAP
jgi:hypothetical protein